MGTAAARFKPATPTHFHRMRFLALILALATLVAAKPWYQGDGLADCAPGKCPATAEVSPIKCSSDLKMYFNNGFPTNCGEGEECDQAEADAASGNPCRPVPAED